MKTVLVEHRFRRETAAYWAEHDIVPNEAEPIFESDTGKFKIGDGVKRLSQLKYFVPESDDSGPVVTPTGTSDLLAHINSMSPHPVYDDGPSLVLLYQNAKV